jgi:hypothetical protein
MFFRNLPGPHRVPSPVADKKIICANAPDWSVSPEALCIRIIFKGDCPILDSTDHLITPYRDL